MTRFVFLARHDEARYYSLSLSRQKLRGAPEEKGVVPSSYEDTHEALKVSLPIRLLGGTPQEKPAQYRVSSPITYAEQVKAPVLIIQGRHDRGCPPRQMEQYVARLQALGKQIEIDWFDSGHGSLHVEEQIGLYERMLTFALSALKAK